MCRIGLDLLYLLPDVVGGTEVYAAGLLHGFSQIDAQHEFIVFLNREGADWPLPSSGNFVRVVCPVAAVSRSRRYLFQQLRLPGLLKTHGVDLVHSLGYVAPLFSPCPAVVTIHDLNYTALKHTLPFPRRIALRFFSVQSARRARHIITGSNFSRSEMSRALKLDPDRITVSHYAPREDNNLSEDWLKLRRFYGIQEPYLVAFGKKAFHKNIPRLLQAFATVKGEFPHSLVLIGHLPANVDSLEFGNSGRIITTGYVPRTHILPLLGHADLFVLPSLYEGFGLPVLEAQQAEVAIACSAAGSLREVAGDGAVFFDPYSVESIAQALRHCLSDAGLRIHLRRLGRENLLRFSWRKAAAETLRVYHSVLNAER